MNYFLPGMGANGRMYAAPWRTISNSVFIDWPDYRDETELTEVAQRIVDESAIVDGDTIVGCERADLIGTESQCDAYGDKRETEQETPLEGLPQGGARDSGIASKQGDHP